MAFKEPSLSDLMKVIWKTVPGGRSGKVETTLSKLSSYAWLGTDSCVNRSESKSTIRLCKNLSQPDTVVHGWSA